MTNCKCNLKQWLLLGLATAVLYFGMDMFFHHYCMGKLYSENAQLFRPMGDMMALMKWSYLGYILFGLLFVCIYSKGVEEGKSGMGQGLRFGFFLGLFYWGTSMLLSYPFMPWPNRIYLDWFVTGLAKFMILGFVVGMLYKPKT